MGWNTSKSIICVKIWRIFIFIVILETIPWTNMQWCMISEIRDYIACKQNNRMSYIFFGSPLMSCHHETTKSTSFFYELFNGDNCIIGSSNYPPSVLCPNFRCYFFKRLARIIFISRLKSYSIKIVGAMITLPTY